MSAIKDPTLLDLAVRLNQLSCEMISKLRPHDGDVLAIQATWTHVYTHPKPLSHDKIRDLLERLGTMNDSDLVTEAAGLPTNTTPVSIVDAAASSQYRDQEVEMDESQVGVTNPLDAPIEGQHASEIEPALDELEQIVNIGQYNDWVDNTPCDYEDGLDLQTVVHHAAQYEQIAAAMACFDEFTTGTSDT